MREIYNKTIEIIKNGEQKPHRDLPYILECTADNFYSWFFRLSTLLIQVDYPKNVFNLDENNEKVVEQIYYFMTCNEKFKGDLHKGLVFCGGFGTGKTIMCKTIADLYLKGARKKFTLIDTEEINLVSSERLEELYKTPLILDELGRNYKEVNDYGTKKTPFATLLTKRNEHNSFTLGTANYDFETLSEIYGEYLTERLIQQFNFIELKGSSRRK